MAPKWRRNAPPREFSGTNGRSFDGNEAKRHAAAPRRTAVIRSWRAHRHVDRDLASADRRRAVVVALSPDGSRAAAVTIEGTVYVWDLATGDELLVDSHAEAGGPPASSLRFSGNGRLLAPTGDRYGMHLFDLSRKTSRIVAAGSKPYHALAITDDAIEFAAITSTLASGRLIYRVEIWRIEPPAHAGAARGRRRPERAGFRRRHP